MTKSREFLSALASSQVARAVGLAIGAGLVWMGLVALYSELGPWGVVRSGVWNGVLFLGAFVLAGRVGSRVAARARGPNLWVFHAAAALGIAALWTLLSEATGVAISDWFLEGSLERIAFFDRLESYFDAAEEYFPSDAGWVAYRFVLGLMIYALAIVVGRAQSASLEIAALERRVQMLVGEEGGGDGAGRDKDHFVIRDGGRAIRLAKRDIELLEGERDYVRVHTPGQKYLVRFPLRKFESLLDSGAFLRVHRSRIVNLGCVAQVVPLGDGRACLRLANGAEVETSRQGGRLVRLRIGSRAGPVAGTIN